MTKKLNTESKAESKAVVSGSVEKKPLRLETYKNAVISRWHNRKISVIRDNKINHIRLIRIAESKEDLEIPSCAFEVVKGKICVTSLGLTDKGIEALYFAIRQYLHDGYTTDR